MEFKIYFKKFGIGWLVTGFVTTVFIFVIAMLTNYSIEEIVNPPWYPMPIFTSILMGIGVFLLGYIGFTRLFWMLLVGEGILVILLVLESGSEGSWSLIITLPLLIVLGLVGVILETVRHFKKVKI